MNFNVFGSENNGKNIENSPDTKIKIVNDQNFGDKNKHKTNS